MARTISAYLKGMEKRLRAASGGLNDQPAETYGRQVGIKPHGAPPNNCGQWYYAIHFAGLQGIDQNALSNDKEIACTVTITRRMAYAPKDRKGSQASSADEILDQADFVADLFHQDDITRIYANEVIAGTAEYVALHGGSASVNGYTTPLKLQAISEIQEMGPDWVGGDDGEGAEKDIFVVAVRFGGAELVKPIW